MPMLQRFLSQDKIGFTGRGLNLYEYASNNPVKFSDPWGLWDTAAHHYFIEQRFSGTVPLELLTQIQAGSNYVDRNLFGQSGISSPQHAMTSPAYPTPDKARQEMCKFIKDNMDAFRRYLNNNSPAQAYNHLGRALHPVMDYTSPLHRDFQYWRLHDASKHWNDEGIDQITPALEAETLGLMNAVVSGDYSALGCGK